MKKGIVLISTEDVASHMMSIRNQNVLLDRDVAMLYGVETRIVNQAVRNNPEKFPDGYILQLDEQESEQLRSKILMLDKGSG